MAVEIPVVVDIHSGFENAAKEVPKEMRVLQSGLSNEALSVKIKLDAKDAGTEVRTFVEDGVTDIKKLRSIISRIKTDIQNLALEGNYNPTEGLGKSLQECLVYFSGIKKNAEDVANSILKQQREQEKYNSLLKDEGIRLASIENTMQGISEKIQAAREALETTKLDSPAFDDVARKFHEINAEMEAVQNRIAELGTKTGSIDNLSLKLNELQKAWNAMPFSEMVDASGQLTEPAREIVVEYTKVSNQIEKQRDILNAVIDKQKEAVAEAKRRKAEEERMIEAQMREEEAAKRHQEALSMNANSMSDLNKKYAAWQQELQRADVGSEKWYEAAEACAQLSNKIRNVSELLASLGTKTGSIDALNTKIQQLNREWNSMSLSEKYIDGDPTKGMTDRAMKIVSIYKDQNEQLKNQALSLERIAQKDAKRIDAINRGAKRRQYENSILNSTVKTMRVLQEQERILSERLYKAPIGGSKYASLKAQLQSVREEIERINADVSGRVNPTIEQTETNLTRTDSRLASLIKNSLRLLAIHTASRFIRNIREVTSEFELQKVALGSIIQDTERASGLFRQIKAAAIESPFEIKDLVSYTKQLSAYRIETDKLFDVTQRLADVSAGLGVDMGRLILAYGQVRAASVLRGQELRQFTEAGIPLVELLAEKFEELGRKGTTTADVFELISKRAVPFSMIEDIFNDMTSAGGMFYKMQEKQAETLLGQWNNLKDAVSIMYDEIGRTESVHNAMTTLIKDAREIMLNWRQWAKIIKVAGTGMIAYVAITKSVVLWDRLLAAAEAAAIKGVTARDLAIKRLTAALFGQSAASAIARRGMALYAAATLNAATTTNVLKAALWNLVAAMASNPFTIAALGAAALVGVFTTLTKRAQTVEERINDANKAINSMGKVRSNDELIKKYEELAQKTNRSVKETAALRDASRELGKVFPLATKAIDNQTGALILDIDKLKEYSETAKNTTKDLMKDLITTNDAQIKTYEKKQKHIEEVLKRGYGFVDGSFYFGLDKDAKNRNVLRMKLLDAADGARQLTQQNQELQDSIDGVKREGNDKNNPYPPVIDGDKLNTLKNQISEITNAYKKFAELTRYMSKDKALENIGILFPSLEGWEPTFENMVATLEGMLSDYKGNLDATRIIEQALANIKFDDIKKNLEKQLKNLQDEIKRSETARNFFNDILDLTGDEKLAATMSVEVYGGLGDSFKERMQQQLNTILGSLDASKITDELRDAFANQNFSVIMANLDKIPEAWHKELKDMADSAQKFSADQIQTWLKELKKVKTYAEERVEIERKTQERIEEIRASELDQATKNNLIAQYQRKQAEDVAKAQYEAFKNSPLYVQMFDDLDNASERVLRLMRERISEMAASWKDFDPVQLKEMQSRLNEIDKQLASRNPFKVLSDSIKRYNAIMKSGRSRRGDETAAMDADAELRKQKSLLNTELRKLNAAKKALEIAQKLAPLNSLEVSVAQANVKAAEKAVEAQQENVNLAEKNANQAAKLAAEWKEIADLIGASSKEMQEYYELFRQLGKVVEDAFSIFLTDELADKVGRTLDIIEASVSGLQGIAKSAAAASAGDIATAFSSGTFGLLGFVSAGFKIADMIAQINMDKWNRELSEQDKIIQRLQRSYDKLSLVMDESFGVDYLYNYNVQLSILLAQQEAYTKQAEIQHKASVEASRKQDREAAAEREEELRADADAINDQLSALQKGMEEFLAGTSRTQAAQDFANAWIEAYKEFGSMTDAMKEKFQEMVQSMVEQSLAAKIMQDLLKPVFDEIDKRSEDMELSAADIAEISRLATNTIPQINDAMNNLMSQLAANGINMRQQAGKFTGISRDIASASEESILGLASGINTQNFYMSQINDNVLRIYQALIGDTTAQTPSRTSAGVGETPQGELSVRDLVNNHLPHIDETLFSVLSEIRKVVKTDGSQHYVSVRM